MDSAVLRCGVPGVGGNIAASIGPQGVLIVDTQFTEIVAKYQAAIRELGGAKIDFAIDTIGTSTTRTATTCSGPTEPGSWLRRTRGEC